jgi:hypothetical protein
MMIHREKSHAHGKPLGGQITMGSLPLAIPDQTVENSKPEINHSACRRR